MAMAKKSGDLKLQATIALTDRISKEVSSIEKSVSGLTKGFGELEASAAGLGSIEVRIDTDGAEEALTGMGDAAGAAGASVDSMAEQAAEADKSVEGLGKTAEETGEKTENAFEGVEKALDNLGYAKGADIIIDKFKEALEEAMEFEKSLAKLSTIADESIGMSELKEEIEALSDDTNKNVNDLSEAAYQAISASVDTAESVGFVADATKLAEGGFTESATAVDVLTTAINAYKLESSDAARVSDMLINTQNLGKTTVDRLASSMGAVIPLAAAYKVQIDQLSTGYVELTRQGIDTAMSGTYLRGMLQELGDSSSKVAQVLKSETGYAFADLMAKGYSLGDVLQVLGDSVNGNSAAFVELWSNIRASTGALALYNAGAEDFNSVLASMTECIGATDAAYAKMTNTTAHAKEGMENATSRLADSIGSNLNPALKGLYEAGDAAFTWMAKVNEACPVVTAALAGLTAGAVTLGGVLTVLAVGQIEAVTAAFGTLNAVMIANPIVAVIAGVVGLGAGLIALASATYEAVDPMEKLTASSERQQREIEELQKEYDGLKSEGKGLSEEALRLKYQIDDLTTSFEANKKTFGDVVAEGEALQSSYDEIIGKYSEVTGGIENETAASLSLIQKLEDISDSTENAADKSAELEAIYNRLGKGLTISGFDDFSDVTADLEGYTEAAKAAVKAQSKKNLKEGLIETGLDYDEQIGKEDAYVKGIEALKKETEEAYISSYNKNSTKTPELDVRKSVETSALEKEITEYDKILKMHTENAGKLTNEQRLDQAALAVLTVEQQKATAGFTDFGNVEETAEKAASVAVDAAGTVLSELKSDYREAYQAALESIQGHTGLFDEMKVSSDLSPRQMIENLESQKKYLTNYKYDLREEAAPGLDAELINELSDGSSESAGRFDAIVKGRTAALDDMNKAYQVVSEAQASWAAQAAIQDADVSLGIDEALRQTYSVIEQMDISEELKAAAREQINDYIEGITGADVSQVSELKILTELKPVEIAAFDGSVVAQAPTDNPNRLAYYKMEADRAAEASPDDINTVCDEAHQKVTETADNMTTNLGAVADEMPELGSNVIIGFINGMNSRQAQLEAAAAALASIVSTAFKGTLDIGSPSRVMMEGGRFAAEGAILGVEEKLGDAENMGRRLGESFSLSYRDSETLKNADGYGRAEYKGDTIIRIDMSGMRNEVKGDYDVDRLVKAMENRLTEALYNTAAGNHR